MAQQLTPDLLSSNPKNEMLSHHNHYDRIKAAVSECLLDAFVVIQYDDNCNIEPRYSVLVHPTWSAT